MQLQSVRWGKSLDLQSVFITLLQNDIRIKQLRYGKDVMDAEKKKPHVSPRQPKEESHVQQISGRQLVSVLNYVMVP